LNYRHNSASTSENASIYPGIEHVGSKERTNYPISLSVEDFGTSLGITSGVVSPLDPNRICGYMEKAMESVAEALDRGVDIDIRHLEVLPAEERDLLLRTWNATEQEYPSDLCIHHLFEQQVERTPDATAVVFMDQSMTYRELNERANCLAHHLIGLGVRPDTRVAICVDRSLAMVVGILAILKSGGAYVPLDPAYASERLCDMVSDADPSVVIVDGSGRMALGEEALSSAIIVDLSDSLSEKRGVERYENRPL
jgi:non-ribosomal peptide synthetase component F